ncbi:MAG: rod shape-determining protein MreC [Candidatus Eremiobacteraeota bacterium]|nr:rod shape-determining protein MreC [Candidatus Eremiobacteraeota bacterium]NNM92331.1 rod shape-determining protein MreC [Candidatus Eremiobacteraeota bacterium]
MRTDERKLLVLLAIVIAAAALAIVQIRAQRAGAPSPIAVTASYLIAGSENLVAGIGNTIGGGASAVLSFPSLRARNAALVASNEALIERNARLHQELADALAIAGIGRLREQNPRAIEARVIGFPPEGATRSITIDRGSLAGVRRDDGVLAPGGVVGHVTQVTPLEATVLLATDFSSRIPAVVRNGRWWGIARGNLQSIRLDYVTLDAPLRIGEIVVTGNGRTFRAGIPIGRIVKIDRNDSSLYQTAILQPSVRLNALDRLLVVAR